MNQTIDGGTVRRMAHRDHVESTIKVRMADFLNEVTDHAPASLTPSEQHRLWRLYRQHVVNYRMGKKPVFNHAIALPKQTYDQ